MQRHEAALSEAERTAEDPAREARPRDHSLVRGQLFAVETDQLPRALLPIWARAAGDRDTFVSIAPGDFEALEENAPHSQPAADPRVPEPVDQFLVADIEPLAATDVNLRLEKQARHTRQGEA